jgi:hypothetical protein
MLKSCSLLAIARFKPWARAIFALLTLGSILSPAQASTFDEYKATCIQRARQEGLTQDVALDVCNCTLQKFKSLYSLPQFQNIVNKSKTDKAAARRLSDVGEACFESVLYEN